MWSKSVAICLVLLSALPLVGADSKRNRLTVSTVCLLEGDSYRNTRYASSLIEQACRRMPNDLVVTPLMPFLSYREGQEQTDLESFAQLARTHNTFLAVALVEHGVDGKEYHTSLLLDRGGADCRQVPEVTCFAR